MEIDITSFFNDADAYEFSASISEMGNCAGKITWANACARGSTAPLLTSPEQLRALRSYVKGFGAWDDEEIAAWSDDECNALFIQLISGDMREIEGLCMGDDGEVDWAEYDRLSEQGTISGNLYRGDDERIYYSLSR
jgi:hypothetical protein